MPRPAPDRRGRRPEPWRPRPSTRAARATRAGAGAARAGAGAASPVGRSRLDRPAVGSDFGSTKGVSGMIAALPGCPADRISGRYAARMPTDAGRRLLTAELLSIGSELTVGET